MLHPSLQAEPSLPELIPVHDFVASRGSNYGYKISPDGKKLAWFAVKGMSLHIFIKDIEGEHIRTFPAGNFYGGFVWAQDSRYLVSNALSEIGTENSLVAMLDTEAANDDPDQKLISPYGGIKSLLVGQVPNDAEHMLIANNQRDKTVFDLYRVNVNTNESTLIAENPGNVTQWLTNIQGELAGRILKQKQAYALEIKTPGAVEYKTVLQWDLNDKVQVVSIIGHGEKIYLLSNKSRDRLVLTEVSSESAEERLIYADPVVDVSSVLVHPVTGKPLVAFTYPDFPKATLLDTSLGSSFDFTKKQTPLGFTVDSSDAQFNKVTMTFITDKGNEYYLYDLQNKRLDRLGSSPSLAHKNVLADTLPIEIISRDNVLLRGYLTLPKGVPSHHLPMVLWVHSGPWERDYWGYNSEIQFLANRGYAVLQINYRGSTGYGRKFQELAIGEFAGKMQDDLLDGVNWAISKGIADPAKIAIAGGSYGGYAALVGLSSTPETFACGIDIFGPTDLAKLIEDFPPYWKLEMNLWYQYVGDPSKEADRLAMQVKSPLYKAGNITKPLMVIHGRDDVRVRAEQSIALVTKLKQDHKEVDFWLVPNVGHGLLSWPLRLRQFRKMEDFLAGCLGGRSMGFDYYQIGTWFF